MILLQFLKFRSVKVNFLNSLLLKLSNVVLFLFRFLADNKNKKQASENENEREQELSAPDRSLEKLNKSENLFSISSSSFESKEEKVQPFFEAEEEEFLKSHGLKDHMDEDLDVQPALTARDIFGKWGDEPSYSTSYPSIKEKSRRDNDEPEPADQLGEELYHSRKHKKEEKAKKKEKKEKSRRSLSPPTSSREKERPLFPGAFAALQNQPGRLSSTREDFELKMSSFDDMPRFDL